MATISAASAPTTGTEHNEILTDDQIEQLLQEAESRVARRDLLEEGDEVDTITLHSEKDRPVRRIRLSKLDHGIRESSYLKHSNGIAKCDAKSLIPSEQRKMAEELRDIDPKTTHNGRVNDQTDAGPDWYHLPKTQLTTQLKRDLQLIEMRNVLDPHRHYKKNLRKGKVPTFSQIGTVIEGPTEWYSSRLNRKERSKNFVEEEMRKEQQTGRFKRKYNEIQDAKTSGKKAHYKKVLAKRQKKP